MRQAAILLIDNMRRAPGIVFADGPAGRRAAVGGTGLDVWEIVATWRAGVGFIDFIT